VIKVDGNYYDGQSSKQIAVVITIEQSGDVLITGHELEIKTTVDQLKIAARLANTPRNIFLANGAKIETKDNQAIDQLCAYFDRNVLYTLLHRLEKKWPVVFIALFITIVFIWGGIEYGVPFASKWAVKGIPYQVEQNIGNQGLETLDKWLFEKSLIENNDQKHLQALFKDVVERSEKQYHYRLELRNSKQMGANALALPGGIIIMTDALVELAENDQQILAVLAHEMGHIEYQHGLRSVLQDSITALFMIGVLGDITSITSLAVTVPTIIVETRYSREFELAADQYAIKYLQQQQIAIEHYIQILTLLEQPKHSKFEFDYLSSHPAMDKRIKVIQDM